MAKLCVTESSKNVDNLYYLQTSLVEILNSSEYSVKNDVREDRAKLSLSCPEYYADVVKMEVCDKIAEVIVIKYKYEYFKRAIKLTGLNEEEKELLLVSLIAADLEDDKKYVYTRLKSYDEIAIDGIYNFRLKQLKKKWEGVVDYMPNCFFGEQLKDFIKYLLEHRKKRVYVDNGKVYDGHYRRLNRNALTPYDKLNVVREVILSNCGELEISGPIPKEDERYLKEYYGEKIIFSTGYYN